MGEYAIRKSDEQEIKIGTCEDMYYLRFEDRFKVRALSGNVNPATDASGLRFRLPFPDEDNVIPGEYEEYNRSVPLVRHSSFGSDRFTDDSIASDAGIIQLTHPSGLLVNVPCYHGVKLPDVGKDCKVFWNGKGYSLALYQLRPIRVANDSGVERYQVFPVVHCIHCGHAWRYTWADIADYLPKDMRARLQPYIDAEVSE
jgi:hypothetical protein